MVNYPQHMSHTTTNTVTKYVSPGKGWAIFGLILAIFSGATGGCWKSERGRT